MDAPKRKKAREADCYIFRASRTVNGVTYYAKDYGLRAFKIRVCR